MEEKPKRLINTLANSKMGDGLENVVQDYGGFWEAIEEPIRPLVKRLRDNGINTTGSCGHKMWVQAEIFPTSQMEAMHRTVFNWLSEQGQHLMNYTIDIHFEVKNGIPFQSFTEIKIEPETKPVTDSTCDWHRDRPRYESQEGYPPGFTIKECQSCGGRFVVAEAT